MDMVWNRWRLRESNDPETPPAIYRRLLPSFLARSGCCIEPILIRRDQLRFCNGFKVGDPSAPTTCPAMSHSGHPIVARCSRDFTRTASARSM